MEIPEFRPTPRQIADLDQRGADLVLLGRLLGAFRRALLDVDFSERESYGLVARLYETLLYGAREPDDEGD